MVASFAFRIVITIKSLKYRAFFQSTMLQQCRFCSLLQRSHAVKNAKRLLQSPKWRFLFAIVISNRGVITILVDFSKKLRELRLSMNLRQEQVARLVGVNKNAISTYENDTRQPSFEILIRLANLYRVSTDYLLGQESNRSADLSGLTEKEATLICELVKTMSKKNERINDLE